jgi:hypothetical protein
MFSWPYIKSGYSAVNKFKFKIYVEVGGLIKYKHRGWIIVYDGLNTNILIS